MVKFQQRYEKQHGRPKFFYGNGKVDEVRAFEYWVGKDPSMLLSLRWVCFFVFTVGVIALELLSRAVRDSYTFSHLTDLREIVRKIIKVLAFTVCLAGSYLVLMPGTFLTIDDNEKWKILPLAGGVSIALARIRISEGLSLSQGRVGWLLGIAAASCWIIILFV
jgi:hypothetical protein